MDNRHASLGRKTLEEIRQKRANERLNKASSGTDLAKPPADVPGIRKSGSATRLSENDISALVSQLKEMQVRNVELEQANKNLSSTLQKTELENKELQKRLNDLEHNTVPSLRKALKDVAMEKDAAVVSREDLSAQLRTLKKRMKEVEEEQYRAEEDAASLRAELNALHQNAVANPSGGSPVPEYSFDQMQAMELEISNLRFKLEQESILRKQDYENLMTEQTRNSTLTLQKQELEAKLASASRITAESTRGLPNGSGFTVEHKEKLEYQLHDMAVAVERLENSRQKLLMEIDSQSSEIEVLFEENSSLSSAYEESRKLAAKWENQVKTCLLQNDELRHMLDMLRAKQANPMSVNGDTALSSSGEKVMQSQYTADFQFLQDQLAKEQSRAEALSAEVLQLSASLEHSKQSYNNLVRLYKPVLKNIENNLLKMKHDGLVVQH